MKPEEYIATAQKIVSQGWNNLPPFLEKQDLVGDALLSMLKLEYDSDCGLSEEAAFFRKGRGAVIDTYRHFIRDNRGIGDKYREARTCDWLEPSIIPFDILEVEQALGVLSNRERYVIKENFYRGMPVRYIASTMGVDQSRVCQIKKRALT